MATRFHNGPVYLGNARWANELFVADGKVIADQEFSQSPDQEELDLQGNTLVPAFRDGHAHPLFAGGELSKLDVTNCNNLEDLGRTIIEYRKSNPTLNWISGGAYDRSLAIGQTSIFLDQFVSDVPLVLHADDHHTIWVNSKALEVASLKASQLPQLRTGSIDVDEHGSPTGFLREFEATQLIQHLAPKETTAERVAHLMRAEKLLLSSGIVEIQDAWIDEGMAEVFLKASPNLKLDYKLLLRADPEQPERVFDYHARLVKDFSWTQNMAIQGIKYFIDGVFGSATALVSSPYDSTGNFGDCNWNLEELKESITRSHNLGLQTHLHAIGDAGIDFALSAIQQAEIGTLPAVIAHAELTSPEILAKAKQLNVTLCLQPFWAQNNNMLLSCVQHIGHHRKDSLYAIKDMLSLGINVAFGSDWPVSSYRPVDGIAVAIHRRSNSAMSQHNPLQAITLEQAIDCYTSGVSRMLGNSHRGTLVVGQDFDATVLTGNLRQKNLDEFFSTEVLSVYKTGVRLLPHN
ncbi:MAG: amidohydrolase [Actinobacteria bacterium]|nr:amidohydrolase [Actinomycetota bacterium]